MGDPYGLPEDLRRLISSRTTTLLPPPPPPPSHDSLSLHHHHSLPPPPPPNYDPINFVGGDIFFPPHHRFPHYYNNSSSSVNPTSITTTTSSGCAATGSDHAFCSSNMMETAEKGWLGFDSGTNRWPRQETLSLLEIRSRLDSKFRENNQKAPLWNEISRIMAEEFGYQRSGKKCKEKFENLYKYYKKTKEGKASRQDGKHYRFFRQLEAICGGESSNTSHHHHAAASNVQTPTSFKINQQDHINNNNNVDHHHHHHIKSSESHLSFSNSSELETSSSENNNNNDEDLSAIAYMLNHQKQHSSSSRDNDDNYKQKGLLLDQQLDDDNNNNQSRPSSHHGGRVRRSRNWRAKVEEIVGSHMRKIIETQDAWMERMLSVVEQREQEMASKEEERKKKESMRFDQEVHDLWAKERAWVEARDAALIEVVRKHIGNNKNLEAMIIGSNNNNNNNKNKSGDGNEYHSSSGGGVGGWSEIEISNLIQLRTGFEQRLIRENNNNNNNGYLLMLENGVWEEIAGKLGCLGYERSANECKQIWDEISISLGRTVAMDESGVAKSTTRPWCLGLKLTDDDDI